MSQPVSASRIAVEPIPLNVPEIQGNEWHYVKACLDTGWVSSVGSFVDRFEKDLASRVAAQFAVATTNGTSALHVALLVAGIRPGDEVLVPSMTFIAPANAIRYAGAFPVFVDAEKDYWQMSPDCIEGFLADRCQRRDDKLYNIESGRPVTAIMPVHILGHPVDLDPILELAKRYGLKCIEDASEALGTYYKGRPIGSHSELACFSFNGNKIATTGGGGVLVTGNAELAQRAKYLTTQAKDDPLEFVHGEIGYNYRLTNVLAAIGCAQLEQLDGFIARKRAIAEQYSAALTSCDGIAPMVEAPWARSTFWQYTVLVDEESFGLSSRDVISALARREIQSRPLWQPMHLSKPHRQASSDPLPVAEMLYSRGLSLPCSSGLSPSGQDRVIEALFDIQRRGS